MTKTRKGRGAKPSETNGHHPSGSTDEENLTKPNENAPHKAQNTKEQLLVDQAAKKKWRNLTVRTIWTFVMIFSFFTIIAAGHLVVILMVIFIQTNVYKEVIALASVPSKERKLPWSRTLNWYFLISTNYFLYGESLIYYFKEIVVVDAFLRPLAYHHRMISFALYCIGFVLFVANLKSGHYNFQFTQFVMTHMALIIVVVQSHFIINNIFEGLIWVLLPAGLVVCNDIFAYICGFFWGKTPLIRLSPKKTWEGFIGGWICTIIFGIIWASLLMRWNYLICPVKDLGVSAFSGLTCDPNPVFIPQEYTLNPWLASLLRRVTFTDIRTVRIAPLQWHVLILTCFASLIAPFGGFFASGVKRTFKIKDFGDSIPGHGGVTDRMDCQFLMGLFSYMYYQSFIKTYTYVYITLSIGSILETIADLLKPSDQLELYYSLQRYLIEQDLLHPDQQQASLNL